MRVAGFAAGRALALPHVSGARRCGDENEALRDLEMGRAQPCSNRIRVMRPPSPPASVKQMADDITNDDPRTELAQVEAQIEDLRETARDLRSSLNDAGPVEPEDRAQVIYEAEQQEAIIGELEMRCDELRKQLGSS